MERQEAKLCLSFTDVDPEYGVQTLSTAAKVLAELRMGRQDRDVTVSWRLASPDCGCVRGIVLCGKVEYRRQWQLDAYLDYVQKRICDMIDERKVAFRLTLGDCQ